MLFLTVCLLTHFALLRYSDTVVIAQELQVWANSLETVLQLVGQLVYLYELHKPTLRVFDGQGVHSRAVVEAENYLSLSNMSDVAV